MILACLGASVYFTAPNRISFVRSVDATSRTKDAPAAEALGPLRRPCARLPWDAFTASQMAGVTMFASLPVIR